FSKRILEPVKSQYNLYIVGIGLGTLAGNCVFIFGGKWLVERITGSQEYLNWVIGGIFAITAIVQAIKMIRHKDAVHKFTHTEENK
ncbi:MAG TPA: lysine transporter LysE, partial [Ferruginibacter sp.]|nr:lysine transporter LysE [Ferruginibacter sp.]